MLINCKILSFAIKKNIAVNNLICYIFLMNILKVLKSFDIFNSEAIRFFQQKAINIFLLETSNVKHKAVNIDMNKDEISINIINKPKTYNLLVSAKRRLEQKRQEEVIK